MGIVVRASTLSAYADCARRTAAKVFRQQVEDAGFVLSASQSNIGGIIGNAVHATMSYTMSEKMKTGTLGSESAAIDAGVESLHRDLQNEVFFDKVTENKNAAERQVIRKGKTMRAYVAPAINPVAVEVRLNAKINSDFELSGQIDVREEDGLIDYKTGKFKRQNSPQYGAYSLLARSNGFNIKRVGEFYSKTVKLDNPDPIPERIEYSLELAEVHARATMADIVTDYGKFLATGDRFSFRANPSSILCDPKYCTAHGTAFCREHMGAK